MLRHITLARADGRVVGSKLSTELKLRVRSYASAHMLVISLIRDWLSGILWKNKVRCS